MLKRGRVDVGQVPLPCLHLSTSDSIVRGPKWRPGARDIAVMARAKNVALTDVFISSFINDMVEGTGWGERKFREKYI